MIQTLVAIVIGGAIVIATNWISAQGEKKKAVQDWYEQNYITGGVDPLLTYFVGLEFHLRGLGLSNRTELPSIELVPLEALTRTQGLLNSNVLTSTTLFIYEYLGGPSIVVVPSSVAATIGKVGRTLLQLRKKVLEAVPTQVNSKFHQIDLSDIIATFKSIEEELNSKIADNLASPG